MSRVCDKLFDTRSFTNKIFKDGKIVNTMVFVGLAEDSKVSSEVYGILRKIVKKASRNEFPDNHFMRKSFRQGMVRSMLDRAIKMSREFTQEQQEKCRALVVRKDKVVSEFVNRKYNLVSTRSRGTRINSAAYNSGYRAGQNVNLNFRKSLR